jgi:hypothetical protein
MAAHTQRVGWFRPSTGGCHEGLNQASVTGVADLHLELVDPALIAAVPAQRVEQDLAELIGVLVVGVGGELPRHIAPRLIMKSRDSRRATLTSE